jgi:hypothetical protein
MSSKPTPTHRVLFPIKVDGTVAKPGAEVALDALDAEQCEALGYAEPLAPAKPAAPKKGAR